MTFFRKLLVLSTAFLLTACSDESKPGKMDQDHDSSCSDKCSKSVCKDVNTVKHCERLDSGCFGYITSRCPDGTSCREGECQKKSSLNDCDECVADVCSSLDTYQKCEPNNEGCMVLSRPVACKSGEYCSEGVCSDKIPETCSDECSADICDGEGAYKVCADTNDDGCKDLSEPISCKSGESCSEGVCLAKETPEPCKDQCTADVCEGKNAYKKCADTNDDGCKDLSEAVSCKSGETCSDGVCAAPEKTCKDECSRDVCDGQNAYKKCADSNKDGCKELSKAIACKADETCENGVCKDVEVTCKYTELKDVPTTFHPMPKMGKGKVEEVTITKDEAGNPYGKTYHDIYLTSPDGRFKVGVRKEYGGAITFLGKAGSTPGHNTTNVIDSNDTGRMVQLALYDGARLHQGCAYDASCLQDNHRPNCDEDMAHLGWNPVQGGNRCKIAADTDKVELKDGEIFTSVEPMTWNPYWDLPNCPDPDGACEDSNYSHRSANVRIDQTLRWVGTNTVEVLNVIHNLDTLDHAASHEAPTMYAPYGGHGLENFYRLFDSNQNEIIPTVICDVNCKKAEFHSPENWVSLQNANKSYGVGIYYEGATELCELWRFTNTANRGSCLSRFAIPGKSSVVIRSYLAIGSLGDINLVFTDLIKKLKPFGYLDRPNSSTPVSSAENVQVSGWALDNKGVKKITVSVDEGDEVEMTYGDSRPDVIKVYPNFAGGEKVGYHGSISFKGLTPKCKHLVTVFATDTDGNKAPIAKTLVSIQ